MYQSVIRSGIMFQTADWFDLGRVSVDVTKELMRSLQKEINIPLHTAVAMLYGYSSCKQGRAADLLYSQEA